MSADHQRLIRTLLGNWSPRPPSDDQMAAYLMAVEDLPVGEVQAAVLAEIRSGGRFPPSGGQVRRAVLRLRDGDGPDPAAAWSETLGQVRMVGRYGRPRLSDLAARTVRYLGGWQSICNSDNEVSLRARFLDTAARLAERAERERLIAPALATVVRELRPGSLYALGPGGDSDSGSEGGWGDGSWTDPDDGGW